MNFAGRDHATIDLHLDGHGTSVELWSEEHDSGRTKRVLVMLDENHAFALALALQAAVAEIQARAVGR